MGEALYRDGKLDDADQALNEAVRLAPSDDAANLALAKVRFDRKDAAGAMALVEPVVARVPDNAEALVLLAKCLIEVKRPEDAAARLTPYVELWPVDFESRYPLAQALRAAGRTAEAQAHFEKYAELQRDVPRLEQLNREVRKDPDSIEIRYEFGWLMWKHISRMEGVVWLQSVLQRDPTHIGAHQALAEHYARIGDSLRSQQHRQAAERRPVTSDPPSDNAEGPSP